MLCRVFGPIDGPSGTLIKGISGLVKGRESSFRKSAEKSSPPREVMIGLYEGRPRRATPFSRSRRFFHNFPPVPEAVNF
jgi:hypothetical protein